MSAKDSAPSIMNETVAELLATVRGLQKDEDDRASSLMQRGSGLTGFVGLILSIAAAAIAATGKSAASGLNDDVRLLTGVLVAAALAVLAIAVVVVVAKVLAPTPGWSIGMDEVERYPTWEFVSQECVMIQGRVMRGVVIALERDREKNATKATWLRRSYWLVCLGLALVAAAGIASTLDRYVV